MSKTDNNPFNDFDFGKMMEMWSENPLVKSIAENDFVKRFTNGEVDNAQMDAIIEQQRKNVEALSQMNAKAAEGLGKMAEQQSQMMKDALAGMQDYAANAPEKAGEGLEKQFGEAQETFQKAMASMMTMGEAAKGAGEDVLEIASARMQESMNDLDALIKKYRP